MSRHEVEDFYENPLQDITVFRFETAGLNMPEHHGAFSLKSIRSGREDYFFHGRSVALRPGQVLLVNAEERYGSEITDNTSSLAVFYRDSELGLALDALTLPPDMLLDPKCRNETREVAQIVLTNDSAVGKGLAALHRALDSADEECATEAATFLLMSALRQNREMAPPTVLREIRKRSTRDELITRVLRARELIVATRGRVRDLDELADAACLSRYHFLRVFTELQGVTPVAFARALRLEAAREALATGAELRAVSRAAGYTTVKSFSRAYRSHFGRSPSRQN